MSADFTVVSDSQVDVIVPNAGPGVYVIHAVLAPSVGRASFWTGFHIHGGTTSPSTGSPVGSSPGGAVPELGDPTNEPRSSVADYVAFRGSSSTLTKATRTKLNRLANEFTDPEAVFTVVAFSNAKQTKKSVDAAKRRALKMLRYLNRLEVAGSIETVTSPASTTSQSRGAIVYVTTKDTEPTDKVSSVIIRLKKGRSPTVNGVVRGSDNVRGSIGDDLTVGAYLGLRMYRIDFDDPVSETVAQLVARDIARDPGIVFAEPDSIVSTQVSVSS